MKNFMRNWGAVVICLLMFLGSLLGQFVSQVAEEKSNAETHGQEFSIEEVWPTFAAATFENWQSEFLQLAFQSLLIASVYQRYIFRKDFSADKDDVAELNTKLDQLIQKQESGDSNG